MLDGEGEGSLADKFLLCILDRKYFGFGHYDIPSASKHDGSAAQAVRDCRPQVIYIEYDGKHIFIKCYGTACCASGRVVREGGQHSRVHKAVLLHVTLRWDQRGFTRTILNGGQLHTEVANEAGTIENASHTGFSFLVHGTKASRTLCLQPPRTTNIAPR